MFRIWPSVSSRWCRNCCLSSSRCARFSSFFSIVRIFFSPESTVPSLYAKSLRGSLISATSTPFCRFGLSFPCGAPSNDRRCWIPAPCEIRLARSFAAGAAPEVPEPGEQARGQLRLRRRGRALAPEVDVQVLDLLDQEQDRATGRAELLTGVVLEPLPPTAQEFELLFIEAGHWAPGGWHRTVHRIHRPWRTGASDRPASNERN